MRHISFALTEKQFVAGTKTVTRRLGWRRLKPGDRLVAVRKSQGIPRGEHPVALGIIEVVSVRQEPLLRVTSEDVILEGFPEMAPWDFVRMFCEHMSCQPEAEVTRIEFRKVSGPTEQTPIAGPPRYGRGSLLTCSWGTGSVPLVIHHFDYLRRRYVGLVWVHTRRRFFKTPRTVEEQNAFLADGYDHPHFVEARVAWSDFARTKEASEAGSAAPSGDPS